MDERERPFLLHSQGHSRYFFIYWLGWDHDRTAGCHVRSFPPSSGSLCLLFFPHRWNGTEGEEFDRCYHQACDTIDNLNLHARVIMTKAAAHVLATYANSLQGIPGKTAESFVKVQPKAQWAAVPWR